MTLPAGTRLGPYEILAPLGAGAMGEVYRARDNRLARDVAVKIVAANLAIDVAASGSQARADRLREDALRRYEETLTKEHPEARAAAQRTRLTAEIEPY